MLPELGESVTEGTITRWPKGVGDTVAADEALLEVSTDKVDTEIPSPVAGTLVEMSVGADETVAVGSQLGVIRPWSAAPVPEAPKAAEPPRPQADAAPAPAAPAPAPPAPAAPAPAPPAPVAPPSAPPAPATDAASTLRGRTEPMSRLRKVIAMRMIESLQVSAQLTQVVEADVTLIGRLRASVKVDFVAREGVKLTYFPFFAKAAIDVLKAHPKLNATIDADKHEVTYFDHEHLAVAVDTPRGLLSPVIRNAGDLSVGGLAKKIADVAERAHGNQGSLQLAGSRRTHPSRKTAARRRASARRPAPACR